MTHKQSNQDQNQIKKAAHQIREEDEKRRFKIKNYGRLR